MPVDLESVTGTRKAAILLASLGADLSAKIFKSLSEEEIEDGFRFVYQRAKLACEPAGAAATGALLAGKVAVSQGETVVVVVSGGNAAPETASAILAPR